MCVVTMNLQHIQPSPKQKQWLKDPTIKCRPLKKGSKKQRKALATLEEEQEQERKTSSSSTSKTATPSYHDKNEQIKEVENMRTTFKSTPSRVVNRILLVAGAEMKVERNRENILTHDK